MIKGRIEERWGGIPLAVLEAGEKKVFGRPINLRDLGIFGERIT